MKIVTIIQIATTATRHTQLEKSANEKKTSWFYKNDVIVRRHHPYICVYPCLFVRVSFQVYGIVQACACAGMTTCEYFHTDDSRTFPRICLHFGES